MSDFYFMQCAVRLNFAQYGCQIICFLYTESRQIYQTKLMDKTFEFYCKYN